MCKSCVSYVYSIIHDVICRSLIHNRLDQYIECIYLVIQSFVCFYIPVKTIDEKDKSHQRFKNWIFIKGKVATGKTQIEMDYLNKSL